MPLPPCRCFTHLTVCCKKTLPWYTATHWWRYGLSLIFAYAISTFNKALFIDTTNENSSYGFSPLRGWIIFLLVHATTIKRFWIAEFRWHFHGEWHSLLEETGDFTRIDFKSLQNPVPSCTGARSDPQGHPPVQPPRGSFIWEPFI